MLNQKTYDFNHRMYIQFLVQQLLPNQENRWL